MKTCYNCGNSARPETPHGRRNLSALKAALHDFHPLEHFAFCVRRKQWLDLARQNCVGWTNPHHFDASKHHVSAAGMRHVLASLFDNHRMGWVVTFLGALAGASILVSLQFSTL